MAAASPSQLSTLEIAVGVPIGFDASLPPLEPRPGLGVQEAFEEVFAAALATPPCVFSFSGGRDSSSLLALATQVARAHDLPLPVPATLVFPENAESDEESWQRLVLGHLGLLDEWVRLPFTDDLDVVGPVAQEVLLRHGHTWPFNLHFHLPIIKLAAGGSVVTGFAGDEIASASRHCYAERVIASRRIGSSRDLAALMLWAAPLPLRYGVEYARIGDRWNGWTWITRRARRELRRNEAYELASTPRGFGPLLREHLWRHRYVRTCITNFSRMAEPFGVRLMHPFVEAPVLAAFADRWPFDSPRGRRAFVHEVVGDLLPERSVTRTSKAAFTSSLMTETARQFASDWSGHGLDERYIDPHAVRQAWLAPEPHSSAMVALQAAWLADHGPRVS